MLLLLHTDARQQHLLWLVHQILFLWSLPRESHLARLVRSVQRSTASRPSAWIPEREATSATPDESPFVTPSNAVTSICDGNCERDSMTRLTKHLLDFSLNNEYHLLEPSILSSTPPLSTRLNPVCPKIDAIMCNECNPGCQHGICCCGDSVRDNFLGCMIRSCFCGLCGKTLTWADWYEVYSAPKPQNKEYGLQNVQPQPYPQMHPQAEQPGP